MTSNCTHSPSVENLISMMAPVWPFITWKLSHSPYTLHKSEIKIETFMASHWISGIWALMAVFDGWRNYEAWHHKTSDSIWFWLLYSYSIFKSGHCLLNLWVLHLQWIVVTWQRLRGYWDSFLNNIIQNKSGKVIGPLKWFVKSITEICYLCRYAGNIISPCQFYWIWADGPTLFQTFPNNDCPIYLFALFSI